MHGTITKETFELLKKMEKENKNFNINFVTQYPGVFNDDYAFFALGDADKDGNRKTLMIKVER